MFYYLKDTKKALTDVRSLKKENGMNKVLGSTVLQWNPPERTPQGPKALSVIKGCPLLRGYANHTLSNYWAWSLGSRQTAAYGP